MKKIALVLALCLTTACLYGCGGGESSSTASSGTTTNTSSGKDTSGEKFTLHAAYTVAEDENSQHTIKFNRFKEIVEEKTGGNVEIVIHPGSELGSEKEYVEMLQNGEIAFASIATSVLSGFSSALSFYDCPFLFESQDQVIEFSQTDIAKERLTQLEDIDLVGMAATSVGARNFLTVKDKPINSLADMKGMKLRTMETEIQIAGVEMLGAEATPLAYSECYQSMQTGVIDGMENEVDTYLAMKFYEVAPNYTKAGWLQLVHAFVASKEVMESLPEEYQKIVLDAAVESANYATERGIEYSNTTAAEALKEANVNVIELDNTEFHDTLENGGLFTEYADLIGQDVLDWIAAY